MVATLVHLVLWLCAALALVWALSSLGVAVLAVAALRGHRRVVAEQEVPVGSRPPLVEASAVRLVPAVSASA